MTLDSIRNSCDVSTGSGSENPSLTGNPCGQGRIGFNTVNPLYRTEPDALLFFKDVLQECDYGRTYVTSVCEGKPSFDDGKYHNHCRQCPGFGQCIGDYREAHCSR